MVDVIEEAFNVGLNDPTHLAVIYLMLELLRGSPWTSPQSIAGTTRKEVHLVDRFKDPGNRLLYYLVLQCRNPNRGGKRGQAVRCSERQTRAGPLCRQASRTSNGLTPLTPLQSRLRYPLKRETNLPLPALLLACVKFRTPVPPEFWRAGLFGPIAEPATPSPGAPSSSPKADAPV